MRSDQGQAVVDYVALLAVLAVVFVVAAAIRVEPAALGGAVSRTFARGLCIVRGGACDADLQPCVVRSAKLSRESHVNVVVASLGKSRYLLYERRSDGTIAITDFQGRHEQLGGSKGGEISVAGLTVGGEVSLSLLVRHGSGARYVATSGEQADRVLRALTSGDGKLPAPQATFGELRTDRDYGVSGSAGDRTLAEAGFHAGDHDGTWSAADGSRTVTYEHREDWSASVLGARLGDGQAPAESYAVRFGADGRPLELVVTTTGRLDGAGSLPASVAPVAERLLAGARAGGMFTVEAHLDLGDPASAAVARDFVEEVRSRRVRVGSTLAPTARLRAEIARAGTIEGRVYAVEEEAYGSSSGIGVGSSARIERSRLLTALSRGYDGVWRGRDDCLEAG